MFRQWETAHNRGDQSGAKNVEKRNSWRGMVPGK